MTAIAVVIVTYDSAAQIAGTLNAVVLRGYAAATWSLRGEVKAVFAFTVEDGLIREIELLAGDLERLDLG